MLGYRYDFGADVLTAKFDEDSVMPLSSIDLPTRTENAPIVGESSIHDLDDFKNHRLNEVSFTIASEVLEKYFKDEEGNPKPWLFPQILKITKEWMDSCLLLKDNTFPQMLLITRWTRMASEKIYRSIVATTDGKSKLKPILRNFETVGSTDYVDFDTTKPVYLTDEDKSHVSHVVADTESWEQKMASVLEEMPEVVSYVKNQNLGFTIPYVLEGDERNYLPDFIVRVKTPSSNEVINLILEVSGEKRKDKVAKVETARNLWVPAVNNNGSFGHWEFIEITDPWDAKNLIRAFLGNLDNNEGDTTNGK